MARPGPSTGRSAWTSWSGPSRATARTPGGAAWRPRSVPAATVGSRRAWVDDPDLDGYAEECFDGDMQACDDLYHRVAADVGLRAVRRHLRGPAAKPRLGGLLRGRLPAGQLSPPERAARLPSEPCPTTPPPPAVPCPDEAAAAGGPGLRRRPARPSSPGCSGARRGAHRPRRVRPAGRRRLRRRDHGRARRPGRPTCPRTAAPAEIVGTRAPEEQTSVFGDIRLAGASRPAAGLHRVRRRADGPARPAHRRRPASTCT